MQGRQFYYLRGGTVLYKKVIDKEFDHFLQFAIKFQLEITILTHIILEKSVCPLDISDGPSKMSINHKILLKKVIIWGLVWVFTGRVPNFS